jgi:hypothetical protein
MAQSHSASAEGQARAWARWNEGGWQASWRTVRARGSELILERVKKSCDMMLPQTWLGRAHRVPCKSTLGKNIKLDYMRHYLYGVPTYLYMLVILTRTHVRLPRQDRGARRQDSWSATKMPGYLDWAYLRTPAHLHLPAPGNLRR